jgi:polysaccharide deacetylase 2 family uncharacterized protein YibQ
MRDNRAIWCFAVIIWLVQSSANAFADTSRDTINPGLPGIALIIDDLGNQRSQGLQAISLPGPITCAFLPSGPYTRALARKAFAVNKEIMLHLPMQALDHEHEHVEPGTLTLDMSQQQFIESLQQSLAAVPHVSGLNNHMGSLMTRHPGKMAWLMEAISERGDLFFVDSRTTHFTVAKQLANEYGIPSISRNVFLDNQPQPEAIRAQFRRLVAIARRDGTAVGIGHPQPATLQVLAEELEKLPQQGIQLLPVSRLIELQNERRLAWQTSSSP